MYRIIKRSTYNVEFKAIFAVNITLLKYIDIRVYYIFFIITVINFIKKVKKFSQIDQKFSTRLTIMKKWSDCNNTVINNVTIIIIFLITH